MPKDLHRRWRASPELQKRARQLQRAMTPAELKLWQGIRRNHIAGAFFRKQHAVGRFILDFFCAKAKLVIEVDGDSHAEQTEYDLERTRWLHEQKGYRVIRFTNHEVHNHLDIVLERIKEALAE